MRPAARMISLIACDDCSDSLLADTHVPDHYDPAGFSTRASWRAIFHALCTFNKPVRAAATLNPRFCENISPCHCSPELARRSSSKSAGLGGRRPWVRVLIERFRDLSNHPGACESALSEAGWVNRPT